MTPRDGTDWELLSVSRTDDVVLIELNRPEKLNAISVALETEMHNILRSNIVTSSRAVVIAGRGRAFSAGADVEDLPATSPAAVLDYYRGAASVYEAVAALPQPTVAAIHGYCLGGGLELALAADIRIAEEGAQLGFPEITFGLVPSAGGMSRVTRISGTAAARTLFLLGERVSGRRAYELGLVSLIADEGTALSRATETAQQLAAMSPLATQIIKRGIDAAAESSAHTVLLIEQLAHALLSTSGEPMPSVEKKAAPTSSAT